MKTSELKVDQDCFVDQEWLEDYVEHVKAVSERFGVSVKTIQMCESKRKGLHFYIIIRPPIEATLANKLQYLLGDDALRVDFNRARIDAGFPEWNKLFEEPGRQLRIIYRAPDWGAVS